MDAETALMKINNYIAEMEIILSSVDLSTREYRDDYDYDGLPETYEEMLDWMDKNRNMVYNCLTELEDALYELKMIDAEQQV